MNQIFKTKDLSIFKISDKNRSVKNNKTLESIILNNNHLHSNPIIVDKDYFVVDGQHRLEIAKKYGLELYYVIDETADEKTCSILNQARKNWCPKDFVNHYASMGDENYKFLKRCCELFPLTENYFARAFTIGKKSKLQGEIELKYEKEEIIAFLDSYRKSFEKIKEITKFSYKRVGTNYFSALIRMIKHEDFQIEKFLKKLERSPHLVEQSLNYRTTETILEKLEEIYNWREPKDKHVIF